MDENLFTKPFLDIEKILNTPVPKREKKKVFAKLIVLLTEAKDYLPKMFHKNINELIILIGKKPTGSTFNKIRNEIAWLKVYSPSDSTNIS